MKQSVKPGELVLTKRYSYHGSETTHKDGELAMVMKKYDHKNDIDSWYWIEFIFSNDKKLYLHSLCDLEVV